MADIASDFNVADASEFNLDDWIEKGRKVPTPNHFPTGLALLDITRWNPPGCQSPLHSYHQAGRKGTK